MYNCFGFGDVDPIFKVIWEFILKMMLSLEPVDESFLKLAKVYYFDKTKTWFGFYYIQSIFKVTGKFSLKCVWN